MNELRLEKIEAELRAGNLDVVKSAIKKLKQKRLPRPFIVKLANLSRRVGYHRTAIGLLNPIVRPRKPIHPVASQEELIEYAVNLTRVGLVKEAHGILDGIKDQKIPDVSLYKAFCATAVWDYQQTVAFLKKYLEFSNISLYQKLVAQANLAAAYIYCFKFSESEKLLDLIIKTADEVEHKLVLGYAHQTFAEHYICKGTYEKAQSHLVTAKKMLGDNHHRYAIYNSQWTAIAKLISSKGGAEARKMLKQVGKEALQRKVWESARDCDLYAAIYSEVSDQFLKVYFGSPFPAYRDWMLKLYKKKISIPQTYLWCPGEKPKSLEHCFDVANGKDLATGAKLKSGQLLHRLIQTLASDFYQPFRVEGLFSTLFRDEHYRPYSSPRKVHDAIARLRVWLKKNKIPLRIVSTKRGEFHLKTNGPYGLMTRIFDETKDSDDFFILNLRSMFGENVFTMKDVILITEMSRTTCKRFLKRALDKKLLIVKGVGKLTRYSLV